MTVKITKNETDFRIEMAEKLARVEGKIDVLDAKLTPILALQEVVTSHDRQIQFWRGVNATFAAIISLAAAIWAKWTHHF